MPYDTQYHPNNNPLAFPRTVMSLEMRVQSSSGVRQPPLYPQSPVSPRRLSTSAQKGLHPSDLIPPPTPSLTRNVTNGQLKAIIGRLREHTTSSGAKTNIPRITDSYTSGNQYTWNKMNLMRDSTKAMWSRHGCVIYTGPSCSAVGHAVGRHQPAPSYQIQWGRVRRQP